MVSVAHVKFGENHSAIEALHQFVQARQRIHIKFCLRVQSAVIYAHTEPAILLLSKEDGSTVRAITHLNAPAFDKCRELFFQLLELP